MCIKKTILLLALALATLSAFARSIVIDVRTPQEYAGGHIPGALNIDHAVIAQEISKARVAKDDTVIPALSLRPPRRYRAGNSEKNGLCEGGELRQY
jgi:rhodanese-related sulfurtransferase